MRKPDDRDEEEGGYQKNIGLVGTHPNQVSTEAASMLEDILLLENVGPIILCLLAGPFSDRCEGLFDF